MGRLRVPSASWRRIGKWRAATDDDEHYNLRHSPMIKHNAAPGSPNRQTECAHAPYLSDDFIVAVVDQSFEFELHKWGDLRRGLAL
jgi:hypothetical protein